MNPIKVFKDKTGQFRPVNPYQNMIMDERSTSGQTINPDWYRFEQSIIYYQFPDAPDTKPGEVVEAYLQWQFLAPNDLHPRWQDVEDSENDWRVDFCKRNGCHVRQILILASPQESKETDKEEQAKDKSNSEFAIKKEREGELYKAIGANIEKYRKPLKLSQEELGEKLGISRVSMTNIENGKQRLPIHLLRDICLILSVGIDDIVPIGYKPEQSPSAPKVESAEDDKRLEILNRCSPDFYPVKDDSGHWYPAYGHDNVLEAMKQYAALQTSSLQSQLHEKQRECEGLRARNRELEDAMKSLVEEVINQTKKY